MIVLGLGMALVFEGLVFALAPSRLEQALELIRRIPVETRRAIGLGAVALGTAIVWLARSLWG
ncbi:hypothetical protein EV657_105163 [Rhodovulum visakhapatnamense]|nr:hypothetical protein EV657_105163 [Rhodovulum visakhapatnamense]